MGGRGASSGKGKAGGGGGQTYSDEQIISEKRKYSGFNTKDQFVMSKFDANYTFKGFGSEQIQTLSNKYNQLKGPHVSKDGDNAVVNISPSHVFPTKYGYGVIVDQSHTVFVKPWQVWGRNRDNGGYVVNFNRQYYNVKKWGNHDGFSSDSKTALNDFNKVVKLAKQQEKFYKKNGEKFSF